MLEVMFRMCASKAEGSKSISNEGFEGEVRFELDERRCGNEYHEEMGSSKVSCWSFMFDFRILSLSIFDVDSNLYFFRWIHFEYDEILDVDGG